MSTSFRLVELKLNASSGIHLQIRRGEYTFLVGNKHHALTGNPILFFVQIAAIPAEAPRSSLSSYVHSGRGL